MHALKISRGETAAVARVPLIHLRPDNYLRLNNDLFIVQCIFLATVLRLSSHEIAKWLNKEFGLKKRGKYEPINKFYTFRIISL